MKKWLKRLSAENKERMKKVLEITLNSLEVCSYYGSIGLPKLLLSRFEEEGFPREEIKEIFDIINRNEDDVIYFIDPKNFDQLRYGIPEDLNDFLTSSVDDIFKKTGLDLLKFLVSEEKDRFFFLYIGNLDRLCEIVSNLRKETKKRENNKKWLECNSLRLNKHSGKVEYKGEERATFKSGTQNYNLLRLLLERKGQRVTFQEIHKYLDKEGKAPYDKSVIRDIVKNIRNELDISYEEEGLIEPCTKAYRIVCE